MTDEGNLYRSQRDADSPSHLEGQARAVEAEPRYRAEGCQDAEQYHQPAHAPVRPEAARHPPDRHPDHHVCGGFQDERPARLRTPHSWQHDVQGYRERDGGEQRGYPSYGNWRRLVWCRQDAGHPVRAAKASSVSWSLGRNPRTGAVSSRRPSSVPVRPDTSTTTGWAGRVASRSATANPSRSGSITSSSTTSGRRSAACASAPPPSGASPTTAYPPAANSRHASRRNPGWSSTTSTRNATLRW